MYTNVYSIEVLLVDMLFVFNTILPYNVLYPSAQHSGGSSVSNDFLRYIIFGIPRLYHILFIFIL